LERKTAIEKLPASYLGRKTGKEEGGRKGRRKEGETERQRKYVC
jgi:hypothetical protein